METQASKRLIMRKYSHLGDVHGTALLRINPAIPMLAGLGFLYGPHSLQGAQEGLVAPYLPPDHGGGGWLRRHWAFVRGFLGGDHGHRGGLKYRAKTSKNGTGFN